MAQQTTGLGTAVRLVSLGNINPTNPVPGHNGVALSLSGADSLPETFQLNPQIEDAGGNEQTAGTQFTLTAVAAHSGNTSVYTGTITGGGSNAFEGFTFVVAGFTNAVNNGTFICTASTTTTLTLENDAAVAETHAATATQQETIALTYWSQNPSVATVSADGLVTAVGVGQTVIEVSYPFANNTIGATGAQSGNPMHGLPWQKIYVENNVFVQL